MSYTYTAVAFVWLLILGLFALSATGVVEGSWVLLLVIAALAAPLILSLGPTARTTADIAPVLRKSRMEATHAST